MIEVVPEPNRPETAHKLKRMAVEDVKSPVTSLCSVSGYLCAALGSKIMIYDFEDGESLVGIAFLDTNIFITSISCVKSFVIVGDIQKSILFLAFQVLSVFL